MTYLVTVEALDLDVETQKRATKEVYISELASRCLCVCVWGGVHASVCHHFWILGCSQIAHFYLPFLCQG